jgi:hypothetical protein
MFGASFQMPGITTFEPTAQCTSNTEMQWRGEQQLPEQHPLALGGEQRLASGRTSFQASCHA